MSLRNKKLLFVLAVVFLLILLGISAVTIQGWSRRGTSHLQADFVVAAIPGNPRKRRLYDSMHRARFSKFAWEVMLRDLYRQTQILQQYSSFIRQYHSPYYEYQPKPYPVMQAPIDLSFYEEDF